MQAMIHQHQVYIHPEKICNVCYSSLNNYKKGEKGLQLRPFAGLITVKAGCPNMSHRGSAKSKGGRPAKKKKVAGVGGKRVVGMTPWRR